MALPMLLRYVKGGEIEYGLHSDPASPCMFQCQGGHIPPYKPLQLMGAPLPRGVPPPALCGISLGLAGPADAERCCIHSRLSRKQAGHAAASISGAHQAHSKRMAVAGEW